MRAQAVTPNVCCRGNTDLHWGAELTRQITLRADREFHEFDRAARVTLVTWKNTQAPSLLVVAGARMDNA